MTTSLTLAAALVAASLVPSPGPALAATGGGGDRCGRAAVPRTVELALCLDTSGSMSGLIDSAKEKLWAIVNELGSAEPPPSLRVGLLTFGNDGHDPEDGWVRLDVPFTSDLDAISAQLFSLTTNGGTEYVGRVVDHATRQLDWSAGDDALRIVVVAGNESADQDPERPFRDVCRRAEAGGFHVNAIYCGDPEDGLAPAWRDVAVLGDGYFATIDKDHGTLAVATPFDAELARLNAVLNETYVPFGATGAAGAGNQVLQDGNARSMNAPALADRAAAKAGALYRCAWALVDACAAQDVVLAELAEDELPEVMQGMSAEEREAYVAGKAAARAELQAEITALAGRRQEHIARAVAERSLDDGRAFDKVLRDAVRAQAEARGFVFAEPDGSTPAGADETRSTDGAVPAEGGTLAVAGPEDDC